jgi:hypothetical protein
MNEPEIEDDDPEPTCAECGRGLYTEEHDYDCSYGDEEEDDDEGC